MNRVGTWLGHPAAKPTAFVVALAPSLWLFFAAATDRLGANPAEALERASGMWALRMLCVVLAVSPLRISLGLSVLASWRRMLGLFVFFYALLHATAYAVFDMGLDAGEILRDIPKRPFVLVGVMAAMLLTLLAVTSFKRVMRWMGGRRWQWLHRSVYAVALLALLHFYWMRAGKNDFGEVALYACIMVVLLGWRVARAWLGAPSALGGK